MARHYDWSPLGIDSDPIPGDPDAIWDAVTSLDATVRAIEAAVDGIKKVSGGSSELGDSEAIDAFLDQADSVADKLSKAKPRYEVAAKAMREYHAEHGEAQRLSVQALRDAEDAEADQKRAQSAKGDAEPDSPELDSATSDLGLANTAMSDARGKLNRAIGIRDDAADKAKNDIHNKIEDDDVKDSFWDNMSGVADILSNISAVLGVLALVVNVIPVIGQALSAVLGVLALITGVLALILHLGAAIENGEGWDSVIFDVIGVATFGVGRAFNAGAKGLGLASRSLAWGKLSRMSGPVASRLSGGAFAFGSKGPMSLRTAKQVLAAGPFGGRPIAAAFGGIGGDLSSAWGTLRSGNIMSSLAATPSHVSGLIHGMDSVGDLPRLLQGEHALTGVLDDVGNLSEFAMPQLDNAMQLANQAQNYSTVGNIAFGIGGAGTLADSVFGVDIPLVP